MDHQEAIDELVQQVLFDEYAATAQFQTDKQNLYTLAVTSDQQIDDYLTTAISQGVPIDSASKCIILFLKLKIAENAS